MTYYIFIDIVTNFIQKNMIIGIKSATVESSRKFYSVVL